MNTMSVYYTILLSSLLWVNHGYAGTLDDMRGYLKDPLVTTGISVVCALVPTVYKIVTEFDYFKSEADKKYATQAKEDLCKSRQQIIDQNKLLIEKTMIDNREKSLSNGYHAKKLVDDYSEWVKNIPPVYAQEKAAAEYQLAKLILSYGEYLNSIVMHDTVTANDKEQTPITVPV